MLEPPLYRRRHTVLDVSCRVRLSSVSCKLESMAEPGVGPHYVSRPLPWQHRKSIFSVASSTLPSLAATRMRNALASAACYR